MLRLTKANILNTIKNKFSSARLESMNAKIKLMIRRAYGFRNVDNLNAYVAILFGDRDPLIEPTCSNFDQ